ncbi:restriction endonuclease [Lactobacillus sp. PV037]|uniref:HIRAN domain-containing protein n=1 Tax=unclassified Lactobacillus TaxID=2620435 RepID=UPI00223F815F|nr:MULTISPECIES: HIRAN domain-containing protein [unclassified Lactobacillus]QNQ82270.1 restriction endonuclease [Lactobacillus sp. PV012]QNQ83619.1 restriction endonuclease [Lactobacillus sp. PV037]
MEFNNDETIFIPPAGFFEDVLDRMDKMETQIDELKKQYYNNSKNSRDVFLYGCEVVGSQYLDLEDHLIPRLQENDPLILIREAGNHYDEHAINVQTTSGLKLGYLPRKNNLILSRLMDEGNLLFGKVKSFHWDGKKLDLILKVYMHMS